jgi:hypothetical protein
LNGKEADYEADAAVAVVVVDKQMGIRLHLQVM